MSVANAPSGFTSAQDRSSPVMVAQNNERTQDKDKHTDTQPQDMLGVRCHQSCLAKAPSGFTSAQDRSFGAAQASPIAGR